MTVVLPFKLVGQKLVKSKWFPENLADGSKNTLVVKVDGIPNGVVATAYFTLSWENNKTYDFTFNGDELVLDEYITTLPANAKNKYIDYTISMSLVIFGRSGERLTTDPVEIVLSKSNYTVQTSNTPELPKSQYEQLVGDVLNSIVADDQLDETSSNPLQNKAVAKEVKRIEEKIQDVNAELADTLTLDDDGSGNVSIKKRGQSGEGDIVITKPEIADSDAVKVKNKDGTVVEEVHFLTLPSEKLQHAETGKALTVTTEAEKVMAYKNQNWCPINTARVDAAINIDLPMDLPRGYYVISATIPNWDNSQTLPPVLASLQRRNADNTVTTVATGLSLSKSLWTQSKPRLGCLYYNEQPTDGNINRLKITATNVELKNICLRYFPETPFDHPTTGMDNTRFDYMGDYDGIVYTADENGVYKNADDEAFAMPTDETTVIAECGVSFSLSHRYQPKPEDDDDAVVAEMMALETEKYIYNSFRDMWARKRIDEISSGGGGTGVTEEDFATLSDTVSDLSSDVEVLSRKVDTLSAGTVPIYEDAPDYEYTALNIDSGWSDFTFVGDKLWVFSASKGEVHAYDDGRISICDPSTGAVEKTLKHDFGHCNTVHYNPRNGKLLIGNLPGNSEYKAALYIFDDVESWNKLEDESNVYFAEKISTIVDVNNIKSAGGTHSYATVACWGDSNMGQNNIVYVNGQYNQYWWKILLGTGTNDLGKGTYTAAEEGEYNGTYKVLWFKEFNRYYETEHERADGTTYIGIDSEKEVTQGIDFVGNKIHTSNGHNELQWWEWDFANGEINRTEHNFSVYKSDGTVNHTVSEGFAIKDGYAYIGCILADLQPNGGSALTNVNGIIKTKL